MNLDEQIEKQFLKDVNLCYALLDDLKENYNTRLMYGAKINSSKAKRTRLLIQDMLRKWG